MAAPASASTEDSVQAAPDRSYTLLEEAGLNPETPDEQIENGDLPLSLTPGAEPVRELETTVNEDGKEYESTIKYFDDGSYSTTNVEIPKAGESGESGVSARGVSGCSSQVIGSWNHRTGCTVSWEAGPLNLNFNADIQVMGGIAGAGKIDSVYNFNHLAVGGTTSNASLYIQKENGNPARAIAGYDYNAVADLGSGHVSVALEVSNLGAELVVAG